MFEARQLLSSTRPHPRIFLIRLLVLKLQEGHQGPICQILMQIATESFGSCPPSDLVSDCNSKLDCISISGGTVQGQDSTQLLLDDCLSAMRYCLKHRPWFHKAQYRLAVALWHEQSPDAAIGELRQLFSRGRKQFTISLWKIIDDEDPERQIWPIHPACISGAAARLRCKCCIHSSKNLSAPDCLSRVMLQEAAAAAAAGCLAIGL